MRNQFAFYKSFDDVAQDLSDIQLATYMRILLDVQFLRIKIEDVKFEDALLNIVWKSQKHSIETSIKGYLDSQKKDSVKNPYMGVYADDIIPYEGGSSNPYEGVAQQEEGKEEDKEKEKVKVQEKEEGKDQGATPRAIIDFYKKNISCKNSDIQEQSSFNEIGLKIFDIEKILLGLKNYNQEVVNLPPNQKNIKKLFFFVRDKIYLDYQADNTIQEDYSQFGLENPLQENLIGA